MKKKSLFYLASTAILIAASSQQIFADEPVKTSTLEPTVEVNKQEAHSSVELQTKEVTQTAPINQTTSSSSSKNEATASSTASTEAKVSEEQNVVKENSTTTTETKKDNKSTFFAAQNNQATARSNPDAQVKKSTFVDVSSHNGHISKEDYQHLAEKGVNGVVVKLTEGTSYKNPYAASQTQNAQAAGMQVSAYAFSHYTNEAEARAEARYFAEEARRLNLPSSTVMVNDIEDSDMRPNINATTQAWADEMRRMGFSNLMYYTSASWLDRNNLRTKGPIQTEQFGLENFWVAQYPTSKLSADDAKTLKYNSEAGAWQFTSQAELLLGRHVFDQSVDYTGRFTNKATPSNRAVNQPIKGKITVQNKNPNTGTFDVIVSDVSAPYGVREVKVPTWSNVNGQDDIIWYTATRQTNGTYKALIKASDHKNSTGLYYIHLYYVQNNGTLIGVGGTSTNVTISAENLKLTGKITIQNNNPKTGTFDVVVSNVSSPHGVREVKLPTWSSVNGQDDIIWYTAAKRADGTYKITVKASDHKNSTGEYNVHLYYIQNNGKLVGVGGTTVQVSKTSYPTPYFSQRDGRWAGRTYGGYTFAATGCVPTTVAMAISGTTGQTVLPTTVADYLYHSTNEFNKRSYGTTSHGIVLAARHWGLKTDVLGSTAAVREALAMGHHVLGAVGTSVFANYPVTHELVMKGYNNGMTYVMDPYNANNNGYYSVDYLFRVRSLDPTDNTEGSPFMTIRS